jgi:signal transduction histidine kinase
MVHVMIDRTRYFTSAELRNEKMISLGKLAAGLAHELNNPASAAVRDAKAMAGELKTAREAAHALARAGLSEPQLAQLEKVQNSCMTSTESISGLAASDREEEISAWLNAHGVQNVPGEELARVSITTEALDRLAGVLQGRSLDVGLRWIAAECSTQSLSTNIERAAARIHSLVASVKGFTRMDRAPEEGPVDISSGLADTVALLNGKARKKSVTVSLDISLHLPRVKGLGAEVNQVWMNLIDNAIDAVPSNGHIDVTATHEGPAVVVRVRDNGPGIPPEIKGSIFDPFFTTKGAGEGTGLGLDIVRRVVEWHNGQVEVESKPGRTEFLVRLPCSDGESGSSSPDS